MSHYQQKMDYFVLGRLVVTCRLLLRTDIGHGCVCAGMMVKSPIHHHQWLLSLGGKEYVAYRDRFFCIGSIYDYVYQGIWYAKSTKAWGEHGNFQDRHSE